MKVKEGLIPTVVGSVVTAGALTLRARDMKRHNMDRREIRPMIETAVIGFGLAHVVLGAIDLISND